MKSVVKELEHHRFQTTKKGKDFVYEIKLFENGAGLQTILRRWYYLDGELPDWLMQDWGQAEKTTRQYNMKLRQKQDIMKYKLIEAK